MRVSEVPRAGLEPAQPLWPKDFKSFVSTIPPSRQHRLLEFLRRKYTQKVVKHKKYKEKNKKNFLWLRKKSRNIIFAQLYII